MKPIVNKTRHGFARWLLGQKAPRHHIVSVERNTITIASPVGNVSAGDPVMSAGNNRNTLVGMVLCIGSDYPPAWRRAWQVLRKWWRK